MKPTDITPTMLRDRLTYEADSGKLYWKSRPVADFSADSRFSAEARARQWNTKFAGREAFTCRANRGLYRKGAIFGIYLLAHRVAFAIHTGRWPDQIDHINGDGSDNRIANLRSVDRCTNHRNRKRPSSNRSGVIGVRWNARLGKWSAAIRANGKQKHLGTFVSKDAAILARRAAEHRLGYHANHGRPA